MKNMAQQGRSMIEMLGVLAIIGVITVGGYGLISKTQNNYQINQSLDQLAEFSVRVRNIAREYIPEYDNKPGEAGKSDFNDFVYSANAYPETLIKHGVSGKTHFSTPYGHELTAIYAFCNEKDQCKNYAQYIISFNISDSDESEELCIQTLTNDWGSVSSNGFLGVVTGGRGDYSTEWEKYVKQGESMPKWDLAKASEICALKENNHIYIQLIFR